MSRLRSGWLAAFIATLPAPAAATPARPATPIALAEAIQVAIQQSPAIHRAVVDLQAARADALAAEGRDDLTLTAAASVSRTPTWDSGGVPGVYREDAATLSVGLARELPSGGVVSGSASGQAVSEQFVPDGTSSVSQFSGLITNLSATLSHPLMRGFGERVARADRRRASYARDVATLQEAAQALDLVRDVIIAYWQVAYARQVVEIRVEGLKLATEQLRITNTAVRTGSVSPTEVVEAEQAIALREQAVLMAEVAVSDLSLEFRRRVGLEVGRDQIDLAPVTSLAPPVQAFDVDATIARAQQDNPLLALLEARGKGADVDLEVSEDALRPRLDVQATVGVSGRSTGAGESFKQLGLLDNPNVMIALGYEQRLGGRGARAARDKAAAQRQRVRVDLEAARREITVSVVHAIDLLRAGQKRIEVSERAIGLARRTLEIQQARFLNGKATNFDVVLRQDELQQASVSRALAVSDALAAEATIEALTGGLLERNHVRIVSP